ncbi:unnamed protein product [Arabidopsis lyrata]|uniref:Uncharacterized protein n=1 Tax=Arabidopsis lyrata subsp. lyrata TaxID=81972 RepID=D7KSG0_ARALL|nr:hypothetical protein ARALYDRAFT_338762 [Arabidopsis lyrata subsp. lyrata]CAH8257058.1 unnamed protein product [Arabidopsis lyrata]
MVSLDEKPCIGSSSYESEANSNSHGDLFFEYLEAAMPFGREPLTDKVPNIPNTIRSIVTKPRCLLFTIPLFINTLRGTSNEEGQSSSKSVIPSKLPLPTFGLACYKFKLSVWSPESDMDENQRVGTLLRTAEEWLKPLN